MKFFSPKNKNGFTLIETVIYVAITAGLLVALTSFILAISGSRTKSFSQQEVNANARLALNIISQKIKSANGVNFATSTFGVHPGVLSLSMASSTLNPTVFALDGSGRLMLAEGVSAAKFITSPQIKITNLIFTNLTADGSHTNIGINLDFSYVSSSNVGFNFSSNLQTAVSLRQ